MREEVAEVCDEVSRRGDAARVVAADAQSGVIRTSSDGRAGEGDERRWRTGSASPPVLCAGARWWRLSAEDACDGGGRGVGGAGGCGRGVGWGSACKGGGGSRGDPA